jgi:hypothetical protein
MTTTSAIWTSEKQEKAPNIPPGLMITHDNQANRKCPNIYITTTSAMLTGDKQDRTHSILLGLMILL